jgi:glycosyltransferase 2 family protein
VDDCTLLRNGKLKKLLITLLKIAISAAIVGYLVYDATQSEKNANVFKNLVEQPKQWGALAGAWACCTIAVFITFFRWWILVRALDIPFRFRDSIRISFWGYLFNLAPLGIVGGDLVKAVMLGHQYPNDRAKGLASVLVDRIIGLYILFIVATAAIAMTNFWTISDPTIKWICNLTFIVTGVSTIGLGVVMSPSKIINHLVETVGKIPRIGLPLKSLIHAVRMYNRKPGVLFFSAVLTVGVHVVFAIGCYLIACGLPGNHLSLADHLVVVPLSNATSVIPLAIGPLEAALEYFYSVVPTASGVAIANGQGLLVALVYRLITGLIASMGIFYYFGHGREMAEVMHEAEEEPNIC